MLKAVAAPAKRATRRIPGIEGREEANFIRSREAQRNSLECKTQAEYCRKLYAALLARHLVRSKAEKA